MGLFHVFYAAVSKNNFNFFSPPTNLLIIEFSKNPHFGTWRGHFLENLTIWKIDRWKVKAQVIFNPGSICEGSSQISYRGEIISPKKYIYKSLRILKYGEIFMKSLDQLA